MKERLQEIGKAALKNIDRVGIGIFAALLIFSGFLFLNESNFQPESIISPPPTPFDELLPNEDYEKVATNMFERDESIEDNPRILRLVQANPFDARRVRETAQALGEIEADYTRAEAAYEAGNLDEATRLVESILRRNPTHRRTLVLQGQIEDARASDD